MPPNAQRDLVEQFRAGTLSRREFIAGAAALGLSAGAIRSALANSAQDTPAPGISGGHTYPLTQEKVTFTALVPHYGVDWQNNEMTRWYEERTGVHIEWQVVTDDAALNQFTLQLAGGDYPDLIFGFNWAPFELTMTQIAFYGAQGVFQPLNEHIAQQGINLAQVAEAYPEAMQIITAPDGQIYSMPYINDCFHCSMPQKLWIYQPWLDQLGLAMPQTTAEFEQVLKSFKEQDPNGNGAADEVPLTSSVGSTSYDPFFMNAFTFNPGKPWLYLVEGTVTPAYIQPGWQEGLKYLRRLYDQGLIDPESFTQDVEGLQRKGNNEEAPLIGACPAGWKAFFVSLAEGEPGRGWEYVTVPTLAGPDGTRQTARGPFHTTLPSVFVVTDKCQDPALAVAWADGLYELETTMRLLEGVPGTHWRWAEEGEIGVDGRPALWTRLPREAATGDITYGWNQLGPSFRSSDTRLGQAVLVDRELSVEVVLYEATRNNYEPYAQPAEWTLPPLVFTTEQAEQIGQIEALITSFVDEQFALFVTGQADVEGGWESYLEAFQGMELEQYLGMYQQAYDAGQG